MNSFVRQLTDASGQTITVSTEPQAKLAVAPSLVETNAEEYEAVKVAMRAFRESRFGDVRNLLSPFASAPSLPPTLVTLARTCIAEGDFPAAERHLKDAEARFPQEPQIWRALAILHRLQRKHVEELTYRRNLLFLVPRPASGAYLAFAKAFAKVHRNDPAPPLGELKFAFSKLASRSQPDEAARREQLEFAQQLYELKPLQSEARAHYLAVSPCPPEQRDVSVAWLPIYMWCDRAGIECRRAHELGRPGHRPSLAELRRVAVLPSLQWAPLLDEEQAAIDGFLMHRVRLHAEAAESPILLHRTGQRAELRIPRELPLVEQPALLLGGMAQYYHQTVDYLSALAVAETLGAPEDLPLVVNDDLAPFQLELLALLGIPESRLIRVKRTEPVRFARLWVPSRLFLATGGAWIDPLLPQWYRQRLTSNSALAGRKLYLSRQATGRRRVVNEEAVVELLAARGYSVVRPEILSVAQQIALFSEASHIVAPTGAALTNMVYAPAGARVVVFYNRYSVAGGTDLYFDALAKASGHAFIRIDCKPVDLHQVEREADADIVVDLESLQAALE